MSDSDLSNQAFTKVIDTVHGANELQGLVNNGILAKSFRVIRGQVDFLNAELAGAVGDYPVLDTNSGAQIHLSDSEFVFLGSFMASTTVTSGGAATMNFGLALSADGASAVVNSLSGGALSIATTNTGTGITVPVNVGVNQWVTATVAVAALTAGVVQVNLIVG